MKSLQCEWINCSQVQELPKNTPEDAQPHELSGRHKLGQNENSKAVHVSVNTAIPSADQEAER